MQFNQVKAVIAEMEALNENTGPPGLHYTIFHEIDEPSSVPLTAFSLHSNVGVRTILVDNDGEIVYRHDERR